MVEFAKMLVLLLFPFLLGLSIERILRSRNLSEIRDETEELALRLRDAERLLNWHIHADSLGERSGIRDLTADAAVVRDDIERLLVSQPDRLVGGRNSGFSAKPAILLLSISVPIYLVLLSLSFYVVKPGYVGLREINGRYSMTEAMPGPHLKIPFIERIEQFDARLKKVHFAKASRRGNLPDSTLVTDSPIEANANDGSDIMVELALEYQVDPQRTAEVVSQYGPDLTAGLVRPAVTEAVRSVLSTYPAEKLMGRGIHETRGLARAVSEVLARREDYPLLIQGIEIDSVERAGRTGVRLEAARSTKRHLEAEPFGHREQSIIATAGREKVTAAEGADEKVGEGKPRLQAEIYFCKGFEKINRKGGFLEYKLLGQSDRFPKDVGKVRCFTRIKGALENIMIKHRWFWQDRLRGEVPLAVRSKNWRTYSEFTILPGQTGTWRVDVTLEDDSLVASGRFVVGPGP